MKSVSLSDILYGAVVVLIIGMQGYYLTNYYSMDQMTISSNTDEIASRTTRIAQLEERLKMLPETQKELELVTAQQEAMLNTIPSGNSAVKQMVTLQKYANVNAFYNAQIVEAGSEVSEDEIATVIRKDYTMQFTSTYNEAKKFIENINAAYQIANINNVSINNSLQNTTDQDQLEKLITHFGGDLSDIVTTDLSFSVYVRKAEEEQGEVYQPGYNMVDGSTSPFESLVKTTEAMTKEVVRQTSAPIVEQRTPVVAQYEEKSSGAVFELYVEDILTSGDTYKLVGPGEEKTYLGLVSQSNTYVTLTINDEGYELSIEDENGNIKQAAYAMDMTQPVLYIESSMRQIQTVMPNVHVYVYNYGADEMKVKLSGSLTQNVHIYDKFDEELSVGETKGNVKLI